MQARMPRASLSSECSETPRMRLPPRNITPGIERSMPACMITSIAPSAATARTAMTGKTKAQDVLFERRGRDDRRDDDESDRREPDREEARRQEQAAQRRAEPSRSRRARARSPAGRVPAGVVRASATPSHAVQQH